MAFMFSGVEVSALIVEESVSSSERALTHSWSIGRSDIDRTVRGGTLIFSTAGPSIRSTFFLFSSCELSRNERDCRDSIFEDMAPSSAWNFVRYDSTDFSISSHP